MLGNMVRGNNLVLKKKSVFFGNFPPSLPQYQIFSVMSQGALLINFYRSIEIWPPDHYQEFITYI